MKQEAWIDSVLREQRECDQDRHTRVYMGSGGKFTLDGREYLNFSSNDYLDLAHHPEVIAASRDLLVRLGAGATASRLLSGTLEAHEELERTLADFKGYPCALLFGSGYLANAGAITSLVGRGDHVLVDRIAHASIVDAAVTSRGRIHRFRHNDCGHLDELLTGVESGRRLVVVQALYSMDGDSPPLEDIVTVAERHDAMVMVDEAHTTGVMGPGGRGLVFERGLTKRVSVSMGTLSKALGGYGGFVTCSHRIRELCLNRARSLIYTTAPAPATVGAALGALKILAREPSLGRALLRRAHMFRARLSEIGFTIPEGQSQIIPVIVGDNRSTMSFEEGLRESGIIASGILPPTVPEGTSRLRISVTLAHGDDDLERAAGVIADTGKSLGVI